MNIFNEVEYYFTMWYKKWRNPENVWYGGSIRRESALASVGGGWGKLINNLYDAKPKNTRVVQIKEKWASLHFYVVNSPDWYEDLIEYYGQKSCKVCEKCGKKGETKRKNGWYKTLCNDCAKEDGWENLK